MAEEYSVSLKVDSKAAVQGLNDANKAVNALDKEFQDLVQEMNGDADKAFESIQNKMLALAQAGKRGTDEYKKYAEMLGRVNQATNAVDKDIENFSASVNDVSANISVMEDRLYELAVQGKQDSEEFKNLVQQVGNLKRAVAETDMVIERASTTNMDLGQQVGLLEDQLYQLAIEGKQNTAEFQKLAKEAGKLKAKIAEADIAIEEYALTNADLGQKVGILTNKMYRLAEQSGINSREFLETARAAAAAQKQVTRVDMAMEAMAMTGAMRVQTAMGGIQGAFDFANGAMQLFGLESERAQKIMMKFQAAMQMTAAIVTMQQALPAITAIKNNVIAGFQGMTTAGKAFAATGIGLVLTAVATLTIFWDDVKAAVSGVTKEQRKLNKEAENKVIQDQRSLDRISRTENILRLQGKSEKEIRQIKMEQLKISIRDGETRVKALIKTAEMEQKAVERNYENAKQIARFVMEMMTQAIRMMAAPIDGIIYVINKASELMGQGKVVNKDLNKQITEMNEAAAKGMAKWIFNPDKTRTENNTIIREAKTQLEEWKNTYAGLQLEIIAESKKTNQTTNDNAQEMLDLTKEIEEERLKVLKDGKQKEIEELNLRYKYELKDLETQLNNKEIRQEQYDQLVQAKLETQKKELADIEEKYRLQQETLDKAAQEAQKQKDDAAAKALEERYKREDEAWLKQQELKMNQYDFEILKLQQKYDNEMLLAEDNAELQKQLTEKLEADIAAIREKQALEELAKRKRRNELLVQGTQDTLKMISDLTEIFAGKSVEQQRRAFKVQKGVQIAQAIMDTYKAANAALASSPPPYNFIAAGAAVTAGLLNVKKIADQKFEAATSGGGGGANAGGVTAPVQSPEFNIVGNANVNALSQFANTPIQTYVVSGDVTTAQALDRNRISNATL